MNLSSESILRVGVLKVLLVLMVLVAVWFVFFPTAPFQEKSLLWLICFLAIFLHKDKAKTRYLTIDLLLCIGAIAVFGWVFLYHEEIVSPMPGEMSNGTSGFRTPTHLDSIVPCYLDNAGIILCDNCSDSESLVFRWSD